MDAARNAGYTVDEPYCVGTKDPNSEFHPTGLSELDDRFGPGYRIFGVTFFYTQPIYLDLWFAAGVNPQRYRYSTTAPLVATSTSRACHRTTGWFRR